MSADPLQVHTLKKNKGLRQSKEIYDGLHPWTGNTGLCNNGEQGTALNYAPRFYETPLKHTRKPSLSPGPLRNRIHSHNLPKRSASPSLSSTSVGKEYHAMRPISTKTSFSYATKNVDPWSVGSDYPSQSSTSPHQRARGPLSVTFSNSVSTDTKPKRSRLVPPSSISLHVKRRSGSSKTGGEPATNGDPVSERYQTQDNFITRYAQGHKTTSRLRSPSHTLKQTVTTKDFDFHCREVHAALSTLGSRIVVLENTLAAALPVVVEARLLWMENAIVSDPVKLRTTRRAFYKNPRYETYTRCIRARAYYLGITAGDLEYMQERLESLGSQSMKQETLLISPFGGANQSGDKTMVEAYRRGSKHGTYARHIWRACYERAYSLDENWMTPIPAPDSSTFVEKIKGWLKAS
ncbi:unnamed protein product [Rhizoctonia solani]|uniref:Uncharacterized protein n=1 Tax=Rhizoctonia solani TaxID=456999 RepID=A0A8H2WYL6_9AGAM|nr:unnamed protein product [Rhizoctonia solani]